MTRLARKDHVVLPCREHHLVQLARLHLMQRQKINLEHQIETSQAPLSLGDEGEPWGHTAPFTVRTTKKSSWFVSTLGPSSPPAPLWIAFDM